MDFVLSKEQWLDFMDAIDAFGIKVIGPRGDTFLLVLRDGVEMFSQNHWNIVLDMWDAESSRVQYLLDIKR